MMSTSFVDRTHDDEIIDLINSILSNGNMRVETINEAVLVKLMEIRNTPIKYDKSFRDIDKDFERWQNEHQPIKFSCSDWEGDTAVSSATVCKKCGREKWEH